MVKYSSTYSLFYISGLHLGRNGHCNSRRIESHNILLVVFLQSG